ncbi:MAG TPA: condensation domain-containing protein [Candidatus Acidoferrales bacterium]|nr:condensation domain-containing protein [Candidatus Acidoferrales bacterium]
MMRRSEQNHEGRDGIIAMNIQEDLLLEQISYWKEELAGAPTNLELPTDQPRPAMQSLRGATETFELPQDLLRPLEDVGRQEQSTLFMILASGFAAMLHRYTGQDDILIGTPVLGRVPGETENSRNRLQNTAVLRSKFSEHLNFRGLLQQVRERTMAAHAHADVPFDQLVAELAPERDSSHAPVVQVLFAFHTAAEAAQAPKGSDKSLVNAASSGYDLALILSETANGLSGKIEYSTDIFAAQSIQRMCGHYTTILTSIALNPHQCISELPMLTERERIQILYDWNSTRAEFPQTCVHQLFEQQVAQHSDSVAVVFEDRQLTYKELNQRANQVANFLRKRGVGPDVLVGVCLERCPEVLVALLGIWKAGGAYVPLDPAYPADRLSFMVKDSAAKVLLTDSKHKPLFASAAGVTF